MVKELNKKINIRPALIIVLLTLLTRLLILYITSIAHQGDLSVLINIDEARYIKEAETILNQGALPWDVLLYPLFLSVFFKIFGTSYLLASILNIILFSLALGVFYLTIASFFGKTRALISATILICYPTLLIDILYPAAEALYLLLLALLFYAFLNYLKYERKIYGALTAVILGSLTLTKETFFLFPVIIMAIIFIRYLPELKRSLPKIFFLAFIYTLILLPLLTYNYHTYGKFALSQKMVRITATLPANLTPINKEKASGLEKTNTISSIKNFLWKRKRFFLGTGTYGLMRAFGYNTKKLEWVANNPKYYFQILEEYGWGWRIFQYLALLFVAGMFLSSFLAMVILLVKKRLKEAASFMLIIFYFLAAYYWRYNSRYFIVLVPFLALLSSYSYSIIYNYILDKIINISSSRSQS